MDNTKEMRDMYPCGYYNGIEIVLTQVEIQTLQDGKMISCDTDDSTVFVSLDKTKG